jgi:acid phosphatase
MARILKPPPSIESVLEMDRRHFSAGLAGAAGLAMIGGKSVHSKENDEVDRRLKALIDTVVVIYAENRSFNNLFAGFPGLAQPLSSVLPEKYLQRDRSGEVLRHLPPVWEGLVPVKQVVNQTEFLIGPGDLPQMPNAPYALRTPDGDTLPHRLITRDLIHSFYNSQLQINGGRNDGFVAWGDSGALVMGHYGEGRENLRLWQIASEFTLCDNFFMGAFGGSFLNHQYLIAARPPSYPDASRGPAKDKIVCFDPAIPGELRPMMRPGTPVSAMDGPVRFLPDTITPDFYAVNTMLPPYMPGYQADPDRSGYASPNSPHTLPAQGHATVGDRLSARGIDWAWYAGGWAAALAGNGEGKGFPSRPNFQPHHQPFNYFARFEPGSQDRLVHLRDGGLGDSHETNQFLADAKAGRLPSVTFYKPQGDLNMHAGYSDIDAGDRHIARVVKALRHSPQWGRMLVIIAFDENGGWWDHVAPPKGDRWGPGTRVPALIVSPHAKKRHVDHTIYDTGSIARFLVRRFGLETLPGLVEREHAMSSAGGIGPGDLVNTLQI